MCSSVTADFRLCPHPTSLQSVASQSPTKRSGLSLPVLLSCSSVLWLCGPHLPCLCLDVFYTQPAALTLFFWHLLLYHLRVRLKTNKKICKIETRVTGELNRGVKSHCSSLLSYSGVYTVYFCSDQGLFRSVQSYSYLKVSKSLKLACFQR